MNNEMEFDLESDKSALNRKLIYEKSTTSDEDDEELKIVERCVLATSKATN